MLPPNDVLQKPGSTTILHVKNVALLHSGYREEKRLSLPRLGLDPDPPAVPVDDPFDEC